MTQEDKELLLKDICARLLYGVKVLDNSHKDYGVSKIINIGFDGSILVDNEMDDIQYYPIIDDIKPYLRPMGSMTGEEKKEFHHIASLQRNYLGDDIFYTHWQMYDWLNKNMFDYRGLIEKGLALVVPDDMYEINKK